MKAQPGYYSLIQYCPDASRLEAVNVGLALLCPTLDYLGVEMTESFERIAKLFGRERVRPKTVEASKRAMKARLTVDANRPRTLEEFHSFIDSRANDLMLTNPRPHKLIGEAPLELAMLFQQLVEFKTPKRERQATLAPDLEKVFIALVREGRAYKNLRPTIPLTGKKLSVPYAYKNGKLNYIKPQRFSSTEGQAADTAMKLAIEGDLIARLGKDEQGEKQLIVVASFSGNRASDSVRHSVKEILKEYRVTTVLPEEVRDFAKRVQVEAHN